MPKTKVAAVQTYSHLGESGKNLASVLGNITISSASFVSLTLRGGPGISLISPYFLIEANALRNELLLTVMFQ